MSGTEQIPSEVSETLRGTAGIEFAVAFGSRITGTPRPSSDLDIAVKFTDGLAPKERFRIQCRLSGQLHGLNPSVDLSDIEELPIEVAHAAVTGQLLCGDRQTFEAYREQIVDQFESTQEIREKEHRDVIRRIGEEGLHG